MTNAQLLVSLVVGVLTILGVLLRTPVGRALAIALRRLLEPVRVAEELDDLRDAVATLRTTTEAQDRTIRALAEDVRSLQQRLERAEAEVRRDKASVTRWRNAVMGLIKHIATLERLLARAGLDVPPPPVDVDELERADRRAEEEDAHHGR